MNNTVSSTLLETAVSIDEVSAVLSLVLGKYTDAWAADWKLWVGMLLWISMLANWMRFGYHGIYWVKAVFTLGYNLVILHLVQQHGKAGLCVSLGTVVLQSGFTSYIWWKPTHLLESKGFSAESLYQDIGGPFLQCLFLFIGQVSLLVMYFCALFRVFDLANANYVYWLVAYFGVQMSAFFNRGNNSQLGKVWNVSLWHSVMHHVPRVEFSCPAFGGELRTLRASRAQTIARGLMGFTVNMLFREALAFTVPVMLMFLPDPFEFVGSCLALNFIVTLDDMEAKEYKVVSVDLPPPPLEKSFSGVATEKSRELVCTAKHGEFSFGPQPSASETSMPGQLDTRSEPESLV